MWCEPDASTFRIRGASYNKDKVKASSAPSLFKLVAIDVFEVPEPTRNISAHPRNRVALATQRGEDFWTFVVNIMVPGPPYLSFVAYLQGDRVRCRQPAGLFFFVLIRYIGQLDRSYDFHHT